MAGVFHISEAEAARDFAAVLRRVRSSDLVVVRSSDGSEALIHSRTAGERGRTVAEALQILRRRSETNALAAGDPEFAADMADVRLIYNAPLDVSRWE